MLKKGAYWFLFLMSPVLVILRTSPTYAVSETYDPFVHLVFFDELVDPLIEEMQIRVSLWETFDIRSGDVSAVDGSLNTSAKYYGEYQGLTTITPELRYFGEDLAGIYQLNLPSIAGFPVDVNYSNAFLQLEYKYPISAPDTSYVIYDFVDDTLNQNITRMKLLKEDQYIASDAGSRTIHNSFTIDDNDNAVNSIKLYFGGTLAKTLEYQLDMVRFKLDDDLFVLGTFELKNNGSGISFRVDDENGDTTPFVIDSSGNVGIGTDSPKSALHVPDGFYAQFQDFNNGSPPAADCDSSNERGRLSIDTSNHRLYICNGTNRGWDYVPLTD